MDAQPPAPSLLAPGRQPGESFEDYQRRRNAGNQRVDAYLRGRWVKPPGRMRAPKSLR